MIRAPIRRVETPHEVAPGVVALSVLVDKGNVERLAEILSQEVGSSSLQRFSVLHHRFDRVGVQCTCETFACRFDTFATGIAI